MIIYKKEIGGLMVSTGKNVAGSQEQARTRNQKASAGAQEAYSLLAPHLCFSLFAE